MCIKERRQFEALHLDNRALHCSGGRGCTHRALPVKLSRKVAPEAGRVLDGSPVQALIVLSAVHPGTRSVVHRHWLRHIRMPLFWTQHTLGSTKLALKLARGCYIFLMVFEDLERPLDVQLQHFGREWLLADGNFSTRCPWPLETMEGGLKQVTKTTTRQQCRYSLGTREGG